MKFRWKMNWKKVFKMKEELVSIVITTYKRADKLKNAVESVLNQTYKNIEVIVVDDNIPGSEQRQETQKVMENYKEKVTYIQNKENLGGIKYILATPGSYGLKVVCSILLKFFNSYIFSLILIFIPFS